jgi:crossover junction endodeoxyribonuclease RuvC
MREETVMKTYIGIDPGKSGAVAIIWESLAITFFEFNSILDFIALLNNHAVFVLIERAQAMPKQGTVSMFNYGVNYGTYLGIFMALNVPFQAVHPAVWKKEFSLIHQDKQRSIEVAKQLFPSVSAYLKKKKDNHKAEALLMADYARRKNM